MSTNKQALTSESARESGSILFIVAARIARREHFNPLHVLCEIPQRVVSTRLVRDAVERTEENLMSEVDKIVRGHDNMAKKLKEAEGKLEAAEKRIAELQTSLAISDFKDAHAYRHRIAELEAREVDLPKRSIGEVMHMSGFDREYAEGWCSGNDNAIHEIRAAGITVKGDSE